MNLTSSNPPTAAPPITPPPAPSPEAAPRRPTARIASAAFVGKVALLFCASCIAVVLTYLAWTLPGAWFANSSTKAWSPAQITLARGSLLNSNTETAQFLPDAAGLAILAINDRFPARNYPVLDWQISSLPEGAVVRLLWRSDYAPNTPRQQDISIQDGRLQPVTLAQNDAWLGTITGLALAIQLPTPQPFTVNSISAHPMDAPEVLMRHLKEWLSFAGWRGTSAYLLEDPGTPPLIWLPLAALTLVCLGAVAIMLARRWRDRYLPDARIALLRTWLYGGLILFCAAWAILDLRWTAQLAQQSAQTWHTYGDKDLAQKHLAAEDGALFAFADKALVLLPQKSVRIFALAEIPYLRSRIAYHLYPHNIYYDLNAPLPDARFLRPGDFVLVFQQRGIQYDAAQKKIRWPNGTEVAAEAKLIDAGSALFEVR